MIARLHIGDIGADFLNHTRRLVTENSRHGCGVFALDVVQVAMTNADRPGAYQHLS